MQKCSPGRDSQAGIREAKRDKTAKFTFVLFFVTDADKCLWVHHTEREERGGGEGIEEFQTRNPDKTSAKHAI